MNKKGLISLSLSIANYNDIVHSIIEFAQKKQSKYTCVANVHMLVEGYNDPEFASVVNNADIITADGKPLTWGLRFIYKIKQDRVAGMDILPDLLQKATEIKLPVFFYGGSGEMLLDTREFLYRSYPDLKIAGLYSPPFRQLTTEEEIDVIDRINGSGARIVFVVLGCPKQERWMAKMKGRINAVMIGIGGALPVLIGNQKRAPLWMQNAGLEWFYRLYQEPMRLFRRYAVTNTLFLYLLTKEFVKVRLLRRNPSVVV